MPPACLLFQAAVRAVLASSEPQGPLAETVAARFRALPAPSASDRLLLASCASRAPSLGPMTLKALDTTTLTAEQTMRAVAQLAPSAAAPFVVARLNQRVFDEALCWTLWAAENLVSRATPDEKDLINGALAEMASLEPQSSNERLAKAFAIRILESQT